MTPSPPGGGVQGGSGWDSPPDEIIRLTTPLSDADVVRLKAGDRVRITGTLYTARDAAHKRLCEALDAGQPLPIDVRGQIIYYTGPTPPPPGKVIGSAGPTTGGRMDRYAPRLLALGLKAMIGKGYRSQPVREAMRHHKAVYFGAVGGAGALLARYITAAEVVAYEDLGTEAIRRLTVEEFPVIVVDDAHGNDLYEEGMQRYARPAEGPVNESARSASLGVPGGGVRGGARSSPPGPTEASR